MVGNPYNPCSDRIQCREAGLSDAEMTALHRLYNDCFPTLRTDCASLAQRLGLNDGSRVLIHFGGDGTPDGFAVLRHDALLLLCVRPECRGHGVGSALLRQAEELLHPYGRAVLGHAPD
ncbi:MAG: GNAT family N-acetyltransferase, partial [Hominenteromicrobium sp.]